MANLPGTFANLIGVNRGPLGSEVLETSVDVRAPLGRGSSTNPAPASFLWNGKSLMVTKPQGALRPKMAYLVEINPSCCARNLRSAGFVETIMASSKLIAPEPNSWRSDWSNVCMP